MSSRRGPRALAAIVLTAALLAGCGSLDAVESTGSPAPADTATVPEARLSARSTPATTKPLAGRRIVIDPGHQLGNRNFPREINRPVNAGGLTKACNTTGTATNSGYPEATFTWRVAKKMRKRLRRLGAKVRLTRTSNSDRAWGPCIDERGRVAKRFGADLLVSVHGDGAPANAYGFHIIVPTARRPWTHRTAADSKRLAKKLRRVLTRRGVPRSTYIGGGTALSYRGDLGTLNTAGVPAVIVELGNMRNAADARRMTTARGRATYANALVRGVRLHLAR